MRSIRLIMLCGLLSLAHFAQADERKLESLEELSTQAKTFLTERLAGQISGRLDIQSQPLDPRLQLTQCSAKIQAYLPPGADPLTTNSIGLHCSAPNEWTVYVPVQVAIYTQVLVTTQPIAPGTLLTDAYFTSVEKPSRLLSRGFFQNPSQIAGLQVKRSLREGDIIGPQDVSEPIVVRKGEVVTIGAALGGLRVTMNGIATQDGRKGEIISVKNQNSGRIVQAVVRDNNYVEVPLS